MNTEPWTRDEEDSLSRWLAGRNYHPDDDSAEAQMWRLLHRALESTADLRALLATLVAAVEAIIYASDQCRGHRDCGHSMEPWQQARAALQAAREAGVKP